MITSMSNNTGSKKLHQQTRLKGNKIKLYKFPNKKFKK